MAFVLVSKHVNCCVALCCFSPSFSPQIECVCDYESGRKGGGGQWGCGSGCGRANMLFIIICSCCYFSCLLLLLMSLLAGGSPSSPLGPSIRNSVPMSVLDVVHIAAGIVVVLSAIVVIFIALHYCCFVVLRLLLLLLSLVCFQQIHNFVDIKLSHVVEF